MISARLSAEISKSSCERCYRKYKKCCVICVEEKVIEIYRRKCEGTESRDETRHALSYALLFCLLGLDRTSCARKKRRRLLCNSSKAWMPLVSMSVTAVRRKRRKNNMRGGSINVLSQSRITCF